MTDPGNESSPGQGAASNCANDKQPTISLSDVEAEVQNLSLVDALEYLDPIRPLLHVTAGRPVHGWLRCPACGRHSADVTSSLTGFCARCGGFTRFQIESVVVASAETLERIGRELLHRKQHPTRNRGGHDVRA